MEILEFYDRRIPKLLQEGKVVAFPTETVYGLGVRYDDIEAYNELIRVKQRPPLQPFTLMGGDNMVISDYAEVTPGVEAVIKAFMPGPITLLLKPKPGIPEHVLMGSDKIGIRISGDKRVRDMIDETGVPILAPSANRSKEKPCVSDKEVVKVFGDDVAVVIKGRCEEGSISSSIFDFSVEGEVVEVRKGEIDLDSIKEVYFNAYSDCE